MIRGLYKALLGRVAVQLEGLTRSDCPHVAMGTIRSLVLNWGTTTLKFCFKMYNLLYMILFYKCSEMYDRIWQKLHDMITTAGGNRAIAHGLYLALYRARSFGTLFVLRRSLQQHGLITLVLRPH